MTRMVQDKWLVPHSIEITGDKLMWKSDFFVDKEQKPGPNLLREFLPLEDADDETIRDYARQWGVLGICKHGLPATHAGMQAENQGCYPLGWPGPCVESLDDWHRFSRQARALLRIAGNLHMGTLGFYEDWRKAYQVAAHYSTGSAREEYKQIVERFDEKSEITWLQSERHQRLALSILADNWIRLGDVRPSLVWDCPGGPEIHLGGIWAHSGLFSALAVQLTFAIAGSVGTATCTACGKVYIPKRRPQAGRRSFCNGCGKQASDRLSKRERRKSNRKADSSDIS